MRMMWHAQLYGGREAGRFLNFQSIQLVRVSGEPFTAEEC